MFGPWALTHVVYVLLVVAFVAIISYMVIYNLRMKAKLKQSGAHPHSKAEEIAMEQELMEHDAHKPHS
jgi:hypothetical protein